MRVLSSWHQVSLRAGYFYCELITTYLGGKVKVKQSLYRPSVAQGVGRGIAILLHDLSTRRGWGVSGTFRPLFTPGKDPVPIVQETGWAPGPVWTGAENLAYSGIRSPDRPARRQSLYRVRYPAHTYLGGYRSSNKRKMWLVYCVALQYSDSFEAVRITLKFREAEENLCPWRRSLVVSLLSADWQKQKTCQMTTSR